MYDPILSIYAISLSWAIEKIWDDSSPFSLFKSLAYGNLAISPVGPFLPVSPLPPFPSASRMMTLSPHHVQTRPKDGHGSDLQKHGHLCHLIYLHSGIPSPCFHSRRSGLLQLGLQRKIRNLSSRRTRRHCNWPASQGTNGRSRTPMRMDSHWSDMGSRPWRGYDQISSA